MLQYDFGERHPLKPQRLARAVELIGRYQAVHVCDPGEGHRSDLARVHSVGYIEGVELIGSGYFTPEGFRNKGGFGSVDNPPFIGMFEASLAYVAGAVEGAKELIEGAKRAFSLSGGLHHALKDKAAGFCVFNDAAIAIDVLKERFKRVAYVDIDVHHGDGVQWLWYDDPSVLTCSIHEDGRTLFPGSGSMEETGSCFSSVNVPIEAKTSGDVWLWAFENTIMPALERFKPEVLVLQLGTDIHYLDPLGHIKATAQEWLGAVELIHELNLPTLAVGGGGYNLDTVPRMWAAAVLTLCGRQVPCQLPEDLAEAWGVPSFFDIEPPIPRGAGFVHAEIVVERFLHDILPNVPSP